MDQEGEYRHMFLSHATWTEHGLFWLQASRTSKGGGESSKKPKAQDLAQWFNKKRLASRSKLDDVRSKVLKRKVPDSEEKAEQSKRKSLKSKAQNTKSGVSDSKASDAVKATETDAKGLPNRRQGPLRKLPKRRRRLQVLWSSLLRGLSLIIWVE